MTPITAQGAQFNYTLNWPFIDIKNNKNTPKNDGFYWKNDKNMLWGDDFINIKHMKIY